MTIIGLDDTDIVGSRGTNQLARRIVMEISDVWRCRYILRHQLLDDPRVPYTSKNGAAGIVLEYRHEDGTPHENARQALRDQVHAIMQSWFVEGSDPGLCILHEECPEEIVSWGLRCSNLLLDKSEAYALAASEGVHLESLGGTEDGVIGALAAVGLTSTWYTGRVIQLGEWPDDLSGLQPLSVLQHRGIQVIERASLDNVLSGMIDVGKHLRPNIFSGFPTLWVESRTDSARLIYNRLKVN